MYSMGTPASDGGGKGRGTNVSDEGGDVSYDEGVLATEVSRRGSIVRPNPWLF